MANIRVTCPTCNAELEIGEEHLGQEVECGSCLGAFKAEDPKSKKKPYKMQRPKDDDRDDDDDDDDRPSRRKKRRRRDEEDDYDYSPPSSSKGGGSGLGIASLVLGIMSFPLLCCCYMNLPTSLGGIICGILALKDPQGKGLGIAGLILSVINLVVFGFFVLFGLGMNAMNFNNNQFR